METNTHRAGFALPAALLALVVVGALVTGGVYTAMAEDRASSNMSHGTQAFVAAERGLEDLLATKDRMYFENMGAVGTTDVIGPVSMTIDGLDAQYTVYVQRLNTRLFRVDSEGEILSGGRYAGTKRRVSQMMRIAYTYVPKDRAVTTQGALRTRGQSGISGEDSHPYADWDGECAPTEGTKTAVVAKDAAGIDVKGKVGLVGDPPSREEPTLDSLDFVQYGDMHLDDLKAMAQKVYTSGTLSGMAPVVDTDGNCDTTVKDNWGAPADSSHACHFYWPIIYSPGDLHVSGGGQGQGILIVDGDLRITGNFEFTGLVFVYGSVVAAGTGNKFTGSVNILNASSDDTEIGEASKGQGNTQIQLSTCAIERAHIYNTRFSRPIPLGQRKFIDVSALGVT